MKKHIRTVPFLPEVGKVYENHGGGTFRCMSLKGGCTAVMQNTKSGWTFTAHDIVRYGDGRIEWGYSTGGRFENVG